MMGYHQVLEEIERLDNKDGVSAKELSANIDVCDQAIRRSIKQLLKDDLIERKLIMTSKGKVCLYKVKKNNLTEGFINGVFKTVADLLHR